MHLQNTTGCLSLRAPVVCNKRVTSHAPNWPTSVIEVLLAVAASARRGERVSSGSLSQKPVDVAFLRDARRTAKAESRGGDFVTSVIFTGVGEG